MSIVCAGLLTVGWTVLIVKIVVKRPDLINTKAAKLVIAGLQLASVVTSGIARFYYTQLTSRSGIMIAGMIG